MPTLMPNFDEIIPLASGHLMIERTNKHNEPYRLIEFNGDGIVTEVFVGKAEAIEAIARDQFIVFLKAPALTGTYALKGQGDICYAYFTVMSATRVSVLALIGAAGMIDRTMTPAEARESWADLQRRGYRRISTQQALKDMPIQRLRLLIYD